MYLQVPVRWLELHKHQSGLSQTVNHAQTGHVIQIPNKLFTPT